MLDRLNQNLKFLENIGNGKMLKIDALGDETPAFLCRFNDNYGVFFPILDNVVINDRCINIFIKTMPIEIEHKKRNVLYLYTLTNISISYFITIALNFLNPENRKDISQNPQSWFNGIKNTIGDSKKKMKIYDVIGELLSFKYIYSKDKTAYWGGSNSETHDIECQETSYEVKTTKLKNNTSITINSAFQLSSTRDLYLFFCRVEQVPNRNTINTLVNDITALGYDKNLLNDELEKLGYPIGNSKRDESYELLEMRKYKVSKDAFPIIPLDDINKFAPKKNIINYTLTIDLCFIDYEKVEMDN